VYCVLFIVCLYICVCKCQLQNNNQQNIETILIAGVPPSQALPGFLITAPPSVCVPDVIGVLAVWIQNQKKKEIVPEPGRVRVKKIAVWRLTELTQH